MLIFCRHIVCLFYLFVPIISLSQGNNNIDRLSFALDNEQHDTSKVLVYIQLAKEYQSVNLDTAFYFANEGLILAKEVNFYHGLAESYASLGDIEVVRDNLDLARDLYLKSVNYFRIVKKEGDLMQVYLVLGNIYLTQDNYYHALNYYHEGLKIAEEDDFKEALEFLYSNLGLLYNRIDNKEKALEFLQKSMEVSKKTENRDNLATIYMNLGSIYYSQHDIQLAKTYYEKARELAIELNNSALYSNVLLGIGEIYEQQGRYDTALILFNKSCTIANQIDDKYLGPKSILFARSYSNIGYIYYNQKKYNVAIEYLEKGYKLANETGQLGIVENDSRILSLCYEAINQNKASLKYARIYKATSDSILNEDVIKKISQIELQNEFEQHLKEQELEQTRKDAIQKRKELIYIMVAAGSVLGLLVFVLLYLLLKNKVTRVELSEKNLKLEKQTLERELEYKNKELTTNVMYLLKKNEFIVNITEKLKVAKLGFKVENKIIAEGIIRELELSSTKNTWKEFELRFQEVHSDFYKKLNEMYPDLSPNEQKLCAFLKLNMTTKEIATITYLSANSINIARHRLRKKLNIEHDENLISFLTKL